MRNASDIFCLNEDGTDGMQMFSVNGSCPMKIKRRNQHRENECFEYGRQLAETEETLGKGDIIADKFEFGEQSNSEEIKKANLIGSNGLDGDVTQEMECQTSQKDIQKKDSELQFHKLNEAPAPTTEVTTSTIMRNPLTGVGMEIKEHRKPKKGLKNLNDKWVW